MLHLQPMEVPRLGVKSELQLLAYVTATATATPDPSHLCNLHHSSQQGWNLNPLRRPGTRPKSPWTLVSFMTLSLRYDYTRVDIFISTLREFVARSIQKDFYYLMMIKEFSG